MVLIFFFVLILINKLVGVLVCFLIEYRNVCLMVFSVLNNVVSELIICVGGLVILDSSSVLLFFSIVWVFSGLFFLFNRWLIFCGVNFLLFGSFGLRNNDLFSVIVISVWVGIIMKVCLFVIVCCSVFSEVKNGIIEVLLFFF